MQKDLISRQMAVETIMGQPPELHYPSWYAAQIEGLPPVQPERKRGRWKEHIFEGIMGGRPRALMCNQCNSLSLHATNFCPNCGADMRGR